MDTGRLEAPASAGFAMDPASGQCTALRNGIRCPSLATETITSRCRCGHLLGGDACARCAAVLREMKRLGTCKCFRCENDGRNPHWCPAREESAQVP